MESVVFSTLEDKRADKNAGLLGLGDLDIQQISCSAQTGAVYLPLQGSCCPAWALQLIFAVDV